MQYVCIGDETYCSNHNVKSERSSSIIGSDLHLNSYNKKLSKIVSHNKVVFTHRIIYGQTSGDTASRRIDIQVDGLRCLFCFEEEKLRDDERGVSVPNLDNIRGLAEKGNVRTNACGDRLDRRA